MNIHSHTPSLVVADCRGLSVRQIGYCRISPDETSEPRVTRQGFDIAGRLISSTDSRLGHPNSSTLFSLSGQSLLTESVDAGWRVSLSGEGGQIVECRDSRGSQSWIEYDDLLRPIAIAEQLKDGERRVVERLVYGDSSEPYAQHNQCGRIVRRDDPAGAVSNLEYAVSGVELIEARRFLRALDVPDWPEDVQIRDEMLEVESYRSAKVIGALNDVIKTLDAQGNCQTTDYTCAGQLKSIGLRLAGREQSQWLVSDIQYNALGTVERETAGNGVVSRAFHDTQSGHLTRLLAVNRDGKALQNLNYRYDPVGNVLSIEDATQTVSFFRNQRVDPVNRYRYDSLYQLIEATGREVAPAAQYPGLPELQPLPLNPDALINYTQRFEYDVGGNLLARHHSGAETWRMATSINSNRSLAQRADGTLPDEEQITQSFDANGNLKTLRPGQTMSWDARNQLSEVTAVVRDDGPDDAEVYHYDGAGMRVRKVRMSQTRVRTLMADVRYLPGLEIRGNNATGEVRHVITLEAGRNTVRVLHWLTDKPDGIENDQLRYGLGDHLGSSTLELGRDARLISHEGYYPFGGTAWWAGSSAVEAKYKTVRYSRKEQDATGLYYYGFRYYAPWLQRWINPDPARDVQGLNRYGFVGNSPIAQREKDGQVYEGINDSFEQAVIAQGDVIHWRGLAEFEPSAGGKVLATLREISEMYTDALTFLSEEPSAAAPIMKSYFGPRYEDALERVKDAFTKTANLASSYSGEWGTGKLVGVEVTSRPANAYVFSTDFHGRIFINVFNIPRSDFKTTLAHELTHVKRVNRIAAQAGAGSVDHFYLWVTEMHTLTGSSLNNYDVKEEGISNVIMNGALNISYLYKQPSFYGRFFKRVSFLNEGPDFKGVGGALSVFNSQPMVSAHMAAENADSLAWSAYTLQRQYLNRQRNSDRLQRVVH